MDSWWPHFLGFQELYTTIFLGEHYVALTQTPFPAPGPHFSAFDPHKVFLHYMCKYMAHQNELMTHHQTNSTHLNASQFLILKVHSDFPFPFFFFFVLFCFISQVPPLALSVALCILLFLEHVLEMDLIPSLAALRVFSFPILFYSSISGLFTVSNSKYPILQQIHFLQIFL